MKRYERTRALVEGDPALARAIVCEVERDGSQGAVAVLDEPREELVMVQARETAQGSLFFLGEALMTSCRVRVGDAVGLGLVLGSDRCRAYELAVVDAVFSGAAGDAVPRLRACRGGRGVLRRGGRRVGFPLGRFPARRAGARRIARPARGASHRGDEG